MASNPEKWTSDAVEQKVLALAEQMGRMIGTVQAKTEGWLDRSNLEEQLTRIRESAADVLAHLNPAAASARPVARRASGSSTSGGSGRARRSAAAGRPGGAGKKSSGPGRSGGKVDAPGKKHRAPMPTVHGVKHSDERIAKLRSANEARRRRKG
jgi:hypothetical protein